MQVLFNLPVFFNFPKRFKIKFFDTFNYILVIFLIEQSPGNFDNSDFWKYTL